MRNYFERLKYFFRYKVRYKGKVDVCIGFFSSYHIVMKGIKEKDIETYSFSIDEIFDKRIIIEKIYSLLCNLDTNMVDFYDTYNNCVSDLLRNDSSDSKVNDVYSSLTLTASENLFIELYKIGMAISDSKPLSELQIKKINVVYPEIKRLCKSDFGEVLKEAYAEIGFLKIQEEADKRIESYRKQVG